MKIKSLDEVINRLQYKADNIKAKLEPSYFTECIEYLKSLPLCDDGWIPCSERLPEKNTWVMVTRSSGIIDLDMLKAKGWICREDFVIAWQPLPQPYVKGE